MEKTRRFLNVDSSRRTRNEYARKQTRVLFRSHIWTIAGEARNV